MSALSELFPVPAAGDGARQPGVVTSDMVRAAHARAAASDPVFVFPHAGGSPRFFNVWRKHWQQGPVWGVTYPGRDARMADPAPATIQHLAADIAQELLPLVTQGVIQQKIRLFGHSMGCLVAYEVAQWLERHRLQWDPLRRVTVQLIASGHNSPEISLPPSYVTVHNKPTSALVRELTRVDERNAEIFAIPELAELIIPFTREDYRLTETYQWDSNFTMIDEVVVAAGSRDPDCFRAGLDGWERYAQRWLGVHTFSGGHFYLAEVPEAVPELLVAIDEEYATQCL